MELRHKFVQRVSYTVVVHRLYRGYPGRLL